MCFLDALAISFIPGLVVYFKFLYNKKICCNHKCDEKTRRKFLRWRKW